MKSAFSALVQFNFYPQSLGPLFGQEGIIAHHLHLQTLGPVSHNRADIPATDHA